MKTKLYFSGITGLIIFLFLNSCDKDTAISEPVANSSENEPVLKTLIIDENIMLEPILSEADDKTEFIIVNDGLPEEDGTLDLDKTGSIHSKGSYYLRYKRLLDSLDLSREQKIKWHYAFVEHKKCVNHYYSELKQLNNSIIHHANMERAKLLYKFKQGLLTRAQLNKKLRELRIETMKTLRNNAKRKALIALIKRCHNEYHENIRLILTKRQWSLWVIWHNNRNNQNQQ